VSGELVGQAADMILGRPPLAPARLWRLAAADRSAAATAGGTRSEERRFRSEPKNARRVDRVRVTQKLDFRRRSPSLWPGAAVRRVGQSRRAGGASVRKIYVD
jgi:hypothetical protein